MEDHLTLTDAARCLGMSLKEASRIVERAGLKTVLFQGRKCYLRTDIIDWLTREFGTFAADRLAAAEQSNAESIGLDPSQLLITDKLFGHIIFPYRVGTGASMLRTMASEACGTGALYDEKALLDQLVRREEAGSTALRCGVALTHPINVGELYVESSLMMLFRPPHPLPFGEASGRMTALFFLLVFPVANEHLHVLARLSRMLRSEDFVEALILAGDPEEMLDRIERREMEIVERF